MDEAHGREGEFEPPAAFRPWLGSGVPHPGADRPRDRQLPVTGAGSPEVFGRASPPPAPRYPAPVSPPPVRVEHVHVNASGGVSGSGLAAFILGILSFLIPWFGVVSFAAIGLGLWAQGSSRAGRGRSGDGFATAGLILGCTSLLLYLVLFRGLMFLFLFR